MEFIWSFLFWTILSIAVGMFASNKRGRSGLGWFFLSFIISPILGFALVAASNNLYAPSKNQSLKPILDRNPNPKPKALNHNDDESSNSNQHIMPEGGWPSVSAKRIWVENLLSEIRRLPIDEQSDRYVSLLESGTESWDLGISDIHELQSIHKKHTGRFFQLPDYSDNSQLASANFDGHASNSERQLIDLASQGDGEAQYELANMYAKGDCIPQDYVRAHMWYNLSAAKGNESAIEKRDTLAEKMTPADVSKAQRIAREWLEKHGGE